MVQEQVLVLFHSHCWTVIQKSHRIVCSQLFSWLHVTHAINLRRNGFPFNWFALIQSWELRAFIGLGEKMVSCGSLSLIWCLYQHLEFGISKTLKSTDLSIGILVSSEWAKNVSFSILNMLSLRCMQTRIQHYWNWAQSLCIVVKSLSGFVQVFILRGQCLDWVVNWILLQLFLSKSGQNLFLILALKAY